VEFLYFSQWIFLLLSASRGVIWYFNIYIYIYTQKKNKEYSKLIKVVLKEKKIKTSVKDFFYLLSS
jgi:hypothetical protein